MPSLEQIARFDNPTAWGLHTITSGSSPLEQTSRFNNATAWGSHTITSGSTVLEQTSRYDNETTFGSGIIGNLVTEIVDLSPTFGSHEIIGGFGTPTLRRVPGDNLAVQLPRSSAYRPNPTVRSRVQDARRRRLVDQAMVGLPLSAPDGTLLIFWEGEWRYLEPNAPNGYVLTLVNGKPEWAS